MAQSGHELVHCTCPLSGVKQTSQLALWLCRFFGSPSGGVILFQWLTGVCKNSTAALFHVKHCSSKSLS